MDIVLRNYIASPHVHDTYQPTHSLQDPGKVDTSQPSLFSFFLEPKNPSGWTNKSQLRSWDGTYESKQELGGSDETIWKLVASPTVALCEDTKL